MPAAIAESAGGASEEQSFVRLDAFSSATLKGNYVRRGRVGRWRACLTAPRAHIWGCARAAHAHGFCTFGGWHERLYKTCTLPCLCLCVCARACVCVCTNAHCTACPRKTRHSQPPVLTLACVHVCARVCVFACSMCLDLDPHTSQQYTRRIRPTVGPALRWEALYPLSACVSVCFLVPVFGDGVGAQQACSSGTPTKRMQTCFGGFAGLRQRQKRQVLNSFDAYHVISSYVLHVD